jgi:hypothetical protein
MSDLERYTPDFLGMSDEQWRALSDNERLHHEEMVSDLKYCHDQHVSLEQWRAQKRGQFEAGLFRPEYGPPAWLRSQYAAERPVEVVLQYLALLERGAVATGDDSVGIHREIQRHTLRGWTFGGETAWEDRRARLMREIDRVGLRELFDEAERQAAKR